MGRGRDRPAGTEAGAGSGAAMIAGRPQRLRKAREPGRTCADLAGPGIESIR